MAQMSHVLSPLITAAFLLTIPSGCYQSTLSAPMTMVSRAHHDLLAQQRASAQDLAPAHDATIKLSIDTAVQIALRTDSDIKISKASLLMAEAEVTSAGQLENPQLRYSQEKLESGFSDNPRMDVEFRFEPPNPGELSARNAIAETDRRVAQARLAMTKNRVVSKIRALFREIAFVDEQLSAARGSMQSSSDLVDLAKTRASQGLGTQIDVALATVALEEVKQEATELAAEADILRETLLRRVGLPANTKLELEIELLQIDALYQLPTEESLINMALANRFELEAATARMEKAEALSYIERSKAWPRLSQIRVGYEMKTGNEFEGAVTGGISLEIPLFNLNGGEIDKAQARELLRSAELDERVEFVLVEVRKQYRQVQAAAEAVRTLQHGAKKAARDATEAAAAAMKAGQVDIQGLAQIEARASAIHRKWLKTLRRYHQEVTQLMESVGADHKVFEPSK